MKTIEVFDALGQASIAHFAPLRGGDAALYTALGVAEPPWRRSADELATDMFHKGVYAGGTGVAYDAIAPELSRDSAHHP